MLFLYFSVYERFFPTLDVITYELVKYIEAWLILFFISFLISFLFVFFLRKAGWIIVLVFSLIPNILLWLNFLFQFCLSWVVGESYIEYFTQGDLPYLQSHPYLHLVLEMSIFISLLPGVILGKILAEYLRRRVLKSTES
jgi:uncharacterized membrane protein AbrB (regulator of aidB expression)